MSQEDQDCLGVAISTVRKGNSEYLFLLDSKIASKYIKEYIKSVIK